MHIWKLNELFVHNTFSILTRVITTRAALDRANFPLVKKVLNTHVDK
jgi:hypothetical protein